MNKKYKLILASKSPRRKELLGHLGIPFEIQTSEIEEVSALLDPVSICKDIALQKGQDVYAHLCKSYKSDSFIISSDTIVVKENEIFGKPRNIIEAKEILLKLSGCKHEVITAFAFIYYDFKKQKLIEQTFSCSTLVTFCEIDNILLADYLKTHDSLDKAGAYGIQGPAEVFISKIEGPYSNVVGLPLSLLTIELIKLVKGIYGDDFIWKNAFS